MVADPDADALRDSLQRLSRRRRPAGSAPPRSPPRRRACSARSSGSQIELAASSRGDAAAMNRIAVNACAAAWSACAAARAVPAGHCVTAQTSFAEIVAQTQPKIVKIFGAGGLRGLEAYQSGFLISGEGTSSPSGATCSIATRSPSICNDGRKLDGRSRRHGPAAGNRRAQDRRAGPAAFQPRRSGRRSTAARVLAFSNMFGVASATSRPACCTASSRPRPSWPPAAARSKRTTAARPTCSTP